MSGGSAAGWFNDIVLGNTPAAGPSEMRNHVAAEHASGRRQYHLVAPWYLAYAILGLITSGMLPFLMPLMVASTTSDLARPPLRLRQAPPQPAPRGPVPLPSGM